jgi:hypothetical protein
MPLLKIRAQQPKRRRSYSRLGKVEAVAPAPHLTLTRSATQFVWQSKLWRVPALLLAALLAYAVFFLFTDELFFVYGSTVTVSGNSRLPADRIYAQAAIDGTSIFFLNHTEVEHRLLQSPNIKSAAVACELPATVAIEVAERQPLFAWQAGGKVYWVDEEGVVMLPAGPAPNTITFIDVDDESPSAVAGGQARVEFKLQGARLDPDIVKAVGELRRWLPQERLFQWSQAQGITFLHAQGFPVYLGKAEDMAEKIVTLRAVIDDLAKTDLRPRFVDLRFPGRPYYR